MLTKIQRDAVFSGIPSILNGVSCTKVVSDQYVLNPTLPNITVKYLSDSVRARWMGQEIRSSRAHRTDDFDCVGGLIEKATIGVTISSEDYDQTMNMAADMLMQLYRDRLGLDWYDYRVRFINTLNAPILTSYRYEQDRRLVHRAHIDFSIEYEVSWQITEPAIRKVGADIAVEDQDSVAHIYELMYAPGLYGMAVTIASDRCIYNLDARLAVYNSVNNHNMDVILFYPGRPTNGSFEIGVKII
jgi:hypothetical protein